MTRSTSDRYSLLELQAHRLIGLYDRARTTAGQVYRAAGFVQLPAGDWGSGGPCRGCRWDFSCESMLQGINEASKFSCFLLTFRGSYTTKCRRGSKRGGRLAVNRGRGYFAKRGLSAAELNFRRRKPYFFSGCPCKFSLSRAGIEKPALNLSASGKESDLCMGKTSERQSQAQGLCFSIAPIYCPVRWAILLCARTFSTPRFLPYDLNSAVRSRLRTVRCIISGRRSKPCPGIESNTRRRWQCTVVIKRPGAYWYSSRGG